MMLQAVAHDVKNKLAELAMRLLDNDIEAAALALDAADKLSQALLLDNPEQLTPQVDAACPADLAEEMAAVYAQLFPEKQVRIDVKQAPIVWYYDVHLLRLALSNAVHNACRHCATAVDLYVTEDKGFLIFQVRNDGDAFPAALVGDSRETASDTGGLHSTRGTGMGLSLSRKIVRAHELNKNGERRKGYLKLANDGGAVATMAIP